MSKLRLELDIINGTKVRVCDIDTRHEALLALEYEENSPEYHMAYDDSDAARAISKSMDQILVAIFGRGDEMNNTWITTDEVIETEKVKLIVKSLENLYHLGQASME